MTTFSKTFLTALFSLILILPFSFAKAADCDALQEEELNCELNFDKAVEEGASLGADEDTVEEYCDSEIAAYDACKEEAAMETADSEDTDTSSGAVEDCTDAADCADKDAGSTDSTSTADYYRETSGSSSSTSSSSTSKAQKTVKLINPLGAGMTDPRDIIGNVIKGVLSIIGSIALLMFIYGGILWITSMGEPKKIQQGKDIITWCVLGLAIIAGAYVLVDAIINGLTTGNVTGA